MGNCVSSHAAPGTFPTRIAALAVLFVVLALLITACGSKPTERQSSTAPSSSRTETEPPESSGPETARDAVHAEPNEEATVTLNPDIIEAQNRFGMLLFQKLAAQERQGAADGDAFDSVFLSPVSVALALGMGYNGAVGDDPHVHFNVANSVWHRRELVFNEAFLRDNQRYYKATVTGLDFGVPGSVGRINA